MARLTFHPDQFRQLSMPSTAERSCVCGDGHGGQLSALLHRAAHRHPALPRQRDDALLRLLRGHPGPQE
eukprot:15320808-Heterocapsa_arctica.AAC.1